MSGRVHILIHYRLITDLCTGCVDTVVNAVERTVGFYMYDVSTMVWIEDEFTCRLQRYLSNVSMMTSNFILACTSFDRAFVVAKPMSTIKRGTKIVIYFPFISTSNL